MNTAVSYLIVLALAALFAAPSPANAGQRYRDWQAERPFTQSAWDTHRFQGGEEVDMDYFLGSGLNTFWDGVRGGSEKSQHPYSLGLPALLMADLRSRDHFTSDFAKAQKTHENLVGVVLGDEVEGDERIKTIRTIRDWIANHSDPAIASMITISSVEQAISPEKLHHLKEGMQPDVFLFQHYPNFRSQGWQASYFSLLERWRTWTRDNDVAFWIYPKAYSSETMGVPSESELRLQRFTALAYGVTGLVDFLWPYISPPTVPGACYWDGSGEPTPLYQQLAPINREIANIAKSLVRLTPVAAYHMNKSGDAENLVRHWIDPDSEDTPNWQRRSWRLVSASGTTNHNNLLVAFFRDDANEEYFMVVNKDAAGNKTGDELAAQVNLTFHPSVRAIQRLRRADAAVERIEVNTNHTFTLPGGTGDLFKIDTGAPFAGIEPIVLPSLTTIEPDNTSTLPRIQGNRIVLQFDGPAHSVAAEIREVIDGRAAGNDISESFTRTLFDDNQTVTYEEIGQALKNNATYEIRLHGSQSTQPLVMRTCRGDVDGDGKLTAQDAARVQSDMGNTASADSRADLNADSVIDALDLQIVESLLKATQKFRFVEDFERYPAGPLTGQGPWQPIETLPARVLSTAVVQGPAIITTDYATMQGSKKVQGNAYPDYRGNEAIIHRDGGFGDTGVLRIRFMGRLGTDSAQRMLLCIANSSDTEGVTGVIHCEMLEADTFRVYTTRGVELVLSDAIFRDIGARQNGNQRPMQVDVLVDFDRNTITWQCENLQTRKQFGPQTVEYRGKFENLDSVSFWICGDKTQMDHILIQNE